MRWPRRSRIRTICTAAVFGAAAGGAIATQQLPAPDQGLRLGYENGQVMVASVDYGSVAQRAGLQPGQVVVQIDDRPVLNEPETVKRIWASGGGPWMDVMTTDPDHYMCSASGSCVLLPPLEYETTWYCAEASGSNVGYLQATGGPGSLPGPEIPDGCSTVAGGSGQLTTVVLYGGPPDAVHDLLAPQQPSYEPIGLGLAILILGWLMLSRGWAGPTLRRYAMSLPVATAVPLMTVSIDGYPSAIAAIGGSVLVPLAMLPLAVDFLGSLEGPRRRLIVGLLSIALGVASCVAGLLMPVYVDALVFRNPIAWRVLLAAAVAFVPGAFAAWSRRRPGASLASGPTPGSLVESIDTLLCAMTPGVAALSLLFRQSIELWPILLWIVLVLGTTRFAVLPLARLAVVTRRQRDLVMDATEAERARIAADIHDFALQDLTMLVRRLDSAGDNENAQSAREVAERLRGICGDLRLPVLDDLGVGPALEWLCGRLSPASGSIALDRAADEVRLPPNVELSVFRIAQEALSNAIRHGAPPITLRYRATHQAVELTVEDSGSGICGDAIDLASRTGHLGMLNMTRRAEAIGAALQIGQRTEGGTRVALSWEAPAIPEAAVAPEPA